MAVNCGETAVKPPFPLPLLGAPPTADAAKEAEGGAAGEAAAGRRQWWQEAHAAECIRPCQGAADVRAVCRVP